MEISLSSKRKLGFVKGTVPVPSDDLAKAEMWETCDNMVISWITSNLSPVISMKTIWEELDSLNVLPTIANPSAEITKLLSDIATQKEESKLFQFLNGLNDVYSPQRSHLLLLQPLSNVESVSATLQQEEARRDLIYGHKTEDMVALYGKGPSFNTSKIYQCTTCGGKGHTQDRCWTIIGYSKWHANYFGNQNTSQSRITSQSYAGNKPKWRSNARTGISKSANVAQYSDSKNDTPMFSSQQLAQLAQLMNLENSQASDSGGEIPETPFSGMMSCNIAQPFNQNWIINSEASDHMTPHLHNLKRPVPVA